MNDKRAKDIMTTDVIVANKNDIIANVANILIKEKIGGRPVVDEENKVVGIISETDIMKKESHVDSPRMFLDVSVSGLSSMLYSSRSFPRRSYFGVSPPQREPASM